MTSTHLMRKVATAVNKAKEHANEKGREGIASAIRGLRVKRARLEN